MKISTKKKTKKMAQLSEKMSNRDVFGYANAEECFQSCRTDFTSVLGIHTYETADIVLHSLCIGLLKPGVSELMASLYCCDAKRCGLNIGGNDSGQDPMVKEIISECSNIGSNGINDPGPRGLAQCVADDAWPFASVTALGDGPGSAFSIEGAQPSGTVSTTPETGSSGPPSTSTGSSSSSLTTKAAVDYHPSEISSASSNDLNNAGKIAVGICSTLAALALIFTVWCIRRRKRSAKGYIQTPLMTRAFKAHYQEPSESHASLISTPAPPPPPLPPPPPAAASTAGARPSQSLTPPMRLSDRRFLPSASSPTSARSFSAPPYSSQPDLAMPEQPFFSAYHTSRTLPPHEKCETMSSIESNYTDAHNYHHHHGTNAAAAAVPRSSVSSSGTTGSSSSRKVVSFVSGCSTATITGPGTPPPPAPPPLSTSRPRRTHETLAPAGLITPAGPPPERALPAAPLRSPPQSIGPPVSPVSPLSPASHSAQAFRSVSPIPSAGEIGVAIGMGQDGIGPKEPSEPAQVRARGKRGTQDSGWGVWMGGPGDAGVVRQAHAEDQSQSADGRRKDQVGVDIVLRELEMAKLSGGC